MVRGFRDFLYSQGFTEIHTPKIGAKSAEGGANLFRLEYFHRPAVLQQSPQFYKQMMVGVFDRVFETAPVFRAEKHNTKRHLNEYTSLDFEMGYIDGFEDIMAMETGFLQYMIALLKKDYAEELRLLGVTLPNVEKIPTVRFDEAKEKVFEMFSTGEKRISDSRRSLGLGLALCRTIIAAHGGTITLSDNTPHGCIFTFTLPLGEVSLHE